MVVKKKKKGGEEGEGVLRRDTQRNTEEIRDIDGSPVLCAAWRRRDTDSSKPCKETYDLNLTKRNTCLVV